MSVRNLILVAMTVALTACGEFKSVEEQQDEFFEANLNSKMKRECNAQGKPHDPIAKTCFNAALIDPCSRQELVGRYQGQADLSDMLMRMDQVFESGFKIYQCGEDKSVVDSSLHYATVFYYRKSTSDDSVSLQFQSSIYLLIDDNHLAWQRL